MKMLILSSILLVTSFNTYALRNRTDLFDCAYLADSPLERVIISEVTMGRNQFYQIDIHSIENGYEKSKTRKVNLLSKYNGNILEFTNGNHRIKIDFVQKRSFGRIPDFDVHSFDWHCKKVRHTF